MDLSSVLYSVVSMVVVGWFIILQWMIQYRKKGIGTVLMNELESRMKQKGCIRSYLLVTRDNMDAIRFYESQGWEQMDLLIYGKDLD